MSALQARAAGSSFSPRVEAIELQCQPGLRGRSESEQKHLQASAFLISVS